MKKLLYLAPLGALMLTMPASAQSPFDGTWKIDVNKVDFSKKPSVYLLQNGMYTCKTCAPEYTIKADGMDHPVTGHPYYDSVAITVVNDHEIKETDKKGGKVVGTSTVTVSPDGKMATVEFSDQSDTNGGPPVKGKGTSTLVEKGPAGSHAISGSWRMDKMEQLSDNGLMWTFKTEGDMLTMSMPTGQSYTAKLNGPDVPMKGDPGIDSVSVKKMGNTIEETDKQNGKPVGIFKVTVAADGKTAKASYTDLRANRTNSFDAAKQ